MIEKYEKYLDIIGGHLYKFFTSQEPYIFCKPGCAICCETGEYPFSKVEFGYAMVGYQGLSEEEKLIVDEKVKEIKKLKKDSIDKKFLHACPFLIDKKCSIYNHRGIICRSYGLMYFVSDKDGNITYKRPCCSDMGLNYSNVFDEKTGMISSEKWAQTGIETEPLSFNVGLDFLTDNNIIKGLELELGEQKAIIDWFEET